ncbi:hypothetical protein JDV02_003483 [Purpureocillium takamizusanense]|uniref:T6SS Phospholipase effector Tle1-like catalytic domain-containing protein n=1 Tax=Purpureocillium takamizusanense TaxID=2060973 RepID=A0A9Q8QE77_9HYPO|nr:uncharacterized protein JDV02_003483 [Purpureocillium takamizusanense]UNI17107.1 hypothetical protein JDV02_003483 [Purpureocillium takamizusanense]
MSAVASHPATEPKKLILCFDGTGNTFSGSNANTNVIKLLNKLDRNNPDQFHYYQTGIGTYDINERSINKTFLGEIQSSISQTIDQGIGTTFDAHVIAGYRFLMRYYNSGDKIYMFGFSRGAFTAKFLARMIYTVGLLCKGNEEMVPFAYRLYQRYLAGEVEEFAQAQEKRLKKHKKNQGNGDSSVPVLNGDADSISLLNGDTVQDAGQARHERKVARDEISAFSNTFCRKEQTRHRDGMQETNIKVYFLGIWDYVNSVAVLERKSPIPVPVKGTAYYVRHAVAVDERRVKFKPALLAQDIRATSDQDEDIKEVWFPGCHGDVGGGWPAVADHPLDSNQEMTLWQRIKNFWTTRRAKEPSGDVGHDPFQMSDVPLAWMISELELVGEKDPSAAVKWSNNVNGFKKRFRKKKTKAINGLIHDSLSFGYGTGFFKVLLWKFMGRIATVEPVVQVQEVTDPDHQTFAFAKASSE